MVTQGDAGKGAKSSQRRPHRPWNAACPIRIIAFHTSALPFKSVEKERIAMDLLLNRRAPVIALVVCALLTCGCQSGVNSSVAPSAISSVSASTGFNDAVVMLDDVLTMQAAPVSYPMTEMMVNSSLSGYSGTCTVANTHAGGIRVKVDGQGVANSLIQFNVVDIADPDQWRTTEYVTVNQQGAFRSGWSAIDAGQFAAGHDLQCWLTQGSATVLASTSNFPAP
jgi:hypothetical protein